MNICWKHIIYNEHLLENMINNEYLKSQISQISDLRSQISGLRLARGPARGLATGPPGPPTRPHLTTGGAPTRPGPTSNPSLTGPTGTRRAIRAQEEKEKHNEEKDDNEEKQATEEKDEGTTQIIRKVKSRMNRIAHREQACMGTRRRRRFKRHETVS